VHLREQVPAASEAAYALEAIERSARTQAKLISNLLALAEAAAGERNPSPQAADRPLLSGVRVLVVDRDGQDLVRLLEIAGADVRVAATSAEALCTLGGWRPDVLVSETNESLIRTLRALPAEKGGCLRAAALTTDARAALAAGYDAQLAKPVEPVALLATVARLAA
jgi:CheY-like chemotaxis protein